MTQKNEIDKLRRSLLSFLKYKEDSINLEFFISSLIDYNPYNSTTEIIEWIDQLNSTQYFEVEIVPLDSINGWKKNKVTGDIVHETGRFFGIKGLSVSLNGQIDSNWCQPIIHQPEVGILGLLAKKIDGMLYFLVQAKAEPGNVNTYQLSPTVQATHSNYEQVHGGKEVPYIEYFFEKNKTEVLVDLLLSEQGGRFYKKKNRNMIVLIDEKEDIPLLENYKWLSLRQIKQLLLLNNTVNMDLRTVLSTIKFNTEIRNEISAEYFNENILNEKIVSNEITIEQTKLLYGSIFAHSHEFSNRGILRKIHEAREKYKLNRCLIPLNESQGWKNDGNQLCHVSGSSFSVIGLRIKSSHREINCWDQPIIYQEPIGIAIIYAKVIEGVIHFLIHMNLEYGLVDEIECGPTIQSDMLNDYDILDYLEGLENIDKKSIYFDAIQSEEGGRFYKYQNRNMITDLKIPDNFELNDNYIWVTPYQLKLLIHQGLYVNIECRSLLSYI